MRSDPRAGLPARFTSHPFIGHSRHPAHDTLGGLSARQPHGVTPLSISNIDGPARQRRYCFYRRSACGFCGATLFTDHAHQRFYPCAAMARGTLRTRHRRDHACCFFRTFRKQTIFAERHHRLCILSAHQRGRLRPRLRCGWHLAAGHSRLRNTFHARQHSRPPDPACIKTSSLYTRTHAQWNHAFGFFRNPFQFDGKRLSAHHTANSQYRHPHIHDSTHSASFFNPEPASNNNEHFPPFEHSKTIQHANRG